MEPIRLWRWEHNQREFFAPLSDDERPYLHKAKTPLGATEYRALPRADFDALVKRAENADVAYRAIGAERDKWERMATASCVAGTAVNERWVRVTVTYDDGRPAPRKRTASMPAYKRAYIDACLSPRKRPARKGRGEAPRG